MTDVFEMSSSEPPKDKLISQFSKWWTEKEIEDMIPNIVEPKMSNSINGALHNRRDGQPHNQKKFAEILYDLVGQNFLVNQNKSIRTRFLAFILQKIDKLDSSFQHRFLAMLVEEKKPKSRSCKVCGAKWNEGVLGVFGLCSLPHCDDAFTSCRHITRDPLEYP